MNSVSKILILLHLVISLCDFQLSISSLPEYFKIRILQQYAKN